MFALKIVQAILVCLWIICGAAAADENQGGKARKVLLIGVDGCRFDAIRKAHAPNFDRLIETGAVAQPIRIYPARSRKADTVSGPGWSSILTGVWADKHGVLDNNFTEPHYDKYPHFFTRLKQVNPKAVTASFSNWPPIAQKITRDADILRNIEPKDQDYAGADTEVTNAAIEYLTNADPTAVFIYLGQVDETGHKHGFHPSVPEYVAAIERVDSHIGQILDAVAKRKNHASEDWLIVLTADHGGIGTGHGGGHDNPEVACSWIIVNGPSVKRGEIDRESGIVDVVPTCLSHLGVPIAPAWQLDGQSLTGN